jgi:hypothetical protein
MGEAQLDSAGDLEPFDLFRLSLALLNRHRVLWYDQIFAGVWSSGVGPPRRQGELWIVRASWTHSCRLRRPRSSA